MSLSKRRVVVTGLGMLSSVGNNVNESWNSILLGKSGIRLIEDFDTTLFKVKIAGTIENYDPKKYFSPKEIKKMDLFLQYGMIAAKEAWEDSGLNITQENPDRIGIAIGSGIGGVSSMEKSAISTIKHGAKKISPFFIPSSIINMISGNLAIYYGLTGPNISLATGCSTGTHNIGYAARTIEYGDADIMITGGAEKSTCAIGIGGFMAARALSYRNDDPTRASRPWDKNRDGFIVADGAGVIVLEEYNHAKRRNANIYAELVGFGMSADGYHITIPNGIGAEKSMINALNDAKLSINSIDYINAHGTSTKLGDVIESKAVESVFKQNAYKLSISSTKSMTGHALGAAGAIEAIFTILSIRDQIAPPTINLDDVDIDCNLDYVPNYAKNKIINAALSNSFGFGGTNCSILFKKI